MSKLHYFPSILLRIKLFPLKIHYFRTFNFRKLYGMRLVKSIPHPKYLIQLHEYNNKMILSIELDDYKQMFKVQSSKMPNLEFFEAKLSEEFLKNCLGRFLEMRTDWIKLLK